MDGLGVGLLPPPLGSAPPNPILEKKFLELIQYNVTVKSHLYARYYFELRALFKDNEREFPLKILNKKDAEKLEINSAIFSD